jgi:uroporphyrin-III C-methyltransferase
MTHATSARGARAAPGTVFLVGAGPGAPDLLTLRAARILGEADVVFHDALVHPDTLALAARAEKIAVGKRCGKHTTAQRFINKRLVDAARSHRVVVRLKGGDPMLFGRAQEEIEALRAAGVPCVVVPGVTAALAAAAEQGVSLTRRGMARSVVFATPRVGEGEAPSSWIDAVRAADTAVLYMAAADATAVRDALLAAGMRGATPAAIAESASLPGAALEAGTLAELPHLAARRGAGPAVVLLGDVFASLAAAQAIARAA